MNRRRCRHKDLHFPQRKKIICQQNVGTFLPSWGGRLNGRNIGRKSPEGQLHVPGGTAYQAFITGTVRNQLGGGWPTHKSPGGPSMRSLIAHGWGTSEARPHAKHPPMLPPMRVIPAQASENSLRCLRTVSGPADCYAAASRQPPSSSSPPVHR